MKRQTTNYYIFLFIISYSIFFGFIGKLNNLNNTPIRSITINPINSESIIPSDPFTQVVEYDLLTRTEIIQRSTENQLLPSEEEYSSDAQEQSAVLKSSYPFPPDDREKITSTSSYPWSTICKLFITAADDTEYIGSGFIVDEFHILTCGHCIYIQENGGWIDELEVVPGMDGNYQPYGSAYATYLRTYTGWIDSEMPEHDWAMVTLDRNIGELTGWMGIMTDSYSSSIYTGTLHTAGYPYDLDDGYGMYYDSDTGEDADEYNHWYWMDTAAGQSGSPVWLVDNQGDPYVLSINAYEYEDGVYPNMGTRINYDKFDQINTWLEEDSSSNHIDKAELLDSGLFSNISTTSIISGVTNLSITCDVKNEGFATASSFKVKYYASINSSITATDYLLGTTTIQDLKPFKYASADWSGIFPSTIPDGNYYIGWIIDADNEIDEENENNNVVFSYNFYVTVETRGSAFNPMDYIYIPIIITIAVIAVVIAVSLMLYRKRFPDLDIFAHFGEVTPQQKYPSMSQEFVKFCPKCGKGVVRQTQKFCINCGFEFDKIIEL